MFDFVDGAAGNESGADLNRSAIDRIRLLPRGLVNVEDRQLTKRFLGRDMGLPFGIAPMGMCNLAWPGADAMLAAEAVRREIPHCLSTAASTSIEDLRAMAGAWAWFQLYVGQSFEAAMALVDRAEAAGYEVLILTVDVPQVSRRLRDLRNGFSTPFRMGPRQFLDFARHPRWSLETLVRGTPTTANFDTGGKGGFRRSESRGSTDWAFLDRLRQRWKKKLIVKGVLSPADAVGIRDAGADAVYVSNHGGRQLEGTPAAIHALPAVREAVGPDYPLIFDSGLRNGEGIVKTLALGADFVMMGRPFLYAIGADGARGLSTMTEVLAQEIDVTLAQIGRRRVEDIDRGVLAGSFAPPPEAAPPAEVSLDRMEG
jgi:L-lactate dehydrogenase (cytochrome)